MEKALKYIVYKTIKALAYLALKFYFRGIDIVGKSNIPKQGPFIFAVNHQNAFLDAVIIGALSKVPTYFMTRSDVFKPPFDWFLDALKMMPIYRIRDGYKTLTKNDAIFNTCKDILADNKALLIFPEGNHGLDYYLRPLTKGLARISLQSQEQITSPIKIIPVGLNYFDHFNSGHKLIIKYGSLIMVNDFMASFRDHRNKGLVAITKSISEGMQKTLVIPENSENYNQQSNIFQRENEKLNFNSLQEKLTDKKFLDEEKQYKFLGLAGELIAVLNWPPIFFTKYIIRTKVSQKIFSASIKYASIILLFPIWFLVCFLLAWLIVGIKWAGILFSIQIITLLLRRELVRYSH